MPEQPGSNGTLTFCSNNGKIQKEQQKRTSSVPCAMTISSAADP
jgi:hypothetical protein